MKILRFLLFPFSILYGGITYMRNILYDYGWLQSKEYEIPIICVGNLTTGGTGKSPMIELLVALLKKNFKVGVLSRGYGRITKGFHEVFERSESSEVGDEPLQIKKKFPEITVAVCENRQTGIDKIKSKLDVILLDDAFQHRKVSAKFTILLTAYTQLFSEDFMLPTGNLREPRSGKKRADIIVVTKCPTGISDAEMAKIEQKLRLKKNQKVFFSKIGYSEAIQNKNEKFPMDYLMGKEFTLVTGIANPKPLVTYLHGKNFNFEHRSFPDHHNFTPSEIQALEEKKLIITTEKDFIRLQHLQNTHIFYLPIETIFIKNEAAFKKQIFDAVGPN
ncbi:tetraacyldisaccharide 4'-kinase [Aequorivita echinoideorum]|uniref:Tetraacyldisaccharide 4'-kinase n=1 Tax=Aequorivita echinoideorum TaxID=1549647 RepID=A0ABS5S7X3_9FLAO|nr:tetraacyldisaccharide 4'-kinase [Aequorivita echinoideorum]MBT0609093.1 tetraacyldisaccharide 4'-kinase [Aequorivita echinoideorum]